MSPLDGTLLTFRSTPADMAAVERRARARMSALVPEGTLSEGVRTEMIVVHEMDAGAQIVGEAQRLGAEMIVLGTHGRSGIGRILMGSVARDVTRRSPVPVVLVA